MILTTPWRENNSKRSASLFSTKLRKFWVRLETNWKPRILSFTALKWLEVDPEFPFSFTLSRKCSRLSHQELSTPANQSPEVVPFKLPSKVPCSRSKNTHWTKKSTMALSSTGILSKKIITSDSMHQSTQKHNLKWFMILVPKSHQVRQLSSNEKNQLKSWFSTNQLSMVLENKLDITKPQPKIHSMKILASALRSSTQKMDWLHLRTVIWLKNGPKKLKFQSQKQERNKKKKMKKKMKRKKEIKKLPSQRQWKHKKSK